MCNLGNGLLIGLILGLILFIIGSIIGIPVAFDLPLGFILGIFPGNVNALWVSIVIGMLMTTFTTSISKRNCAQ
jgi:hypothetical protein